MKTRGALDFRPSEWALAVFVAGFVMAGAGFALRFAALGRPAAAPDIDRGIEVAVKVVPVLDRDAPILKLGGKQHAPDVPRSTGVNKAPRGGLRPLPLPISGTMSG